MKGILGKKIGMTQVFANDGKLIPVTVVSVEPNVVMQIKTKETDGYEAIQLGFTTKKEKHSTKSEMGHAKKANAAPKRFLKEIKGVEVSSYELGQEIKCDMFSVGDMVDVSGKTRGRGFTGVIQRWNHGRHRMTHGVSLVHRAVGSTGANSHVSRVFKGRKMPGQYGNENVTIQNLQIVKVDADRNVLLIKGAIPGATGAIVTIKSAVKAK